MEPTRSKSPRDQAVDVLKEAEIVGGHVHSSATLSQREAVKRQMNESKINIDDVFCQNSVEEANLKKCSCSACNLEKPSDDERNQVKRESFESPKRVAETNVPKQQLSTSNSTPTVEISLDEIFGVASTSSIQDKVVSNNIEEHGSMKTVDDRSANTSVIESAVTLHKPATTDIKKSPSSPAHPDSSSNKVTRSEKVNTHSSDFKPIAEPRKSKEYHVTAETHSEPVPLRSDTSAPNFEMDNGASQSLDWLEKLVSSDDSGSKRKDHDFEISNTVATTSVPRKPARGNEINGKTTHMGVQISSVPPSSSQSESRSAVRKADRGKEKSIAGQDSCEQTRDGSPVMVREKLAEIRPDLSAAEINRQVESGQDDHKQSPSLSHRDPERSMFTLDPEEIHFPHGRTTLVGDILRKPSVLEETSFNTDHLSPKEDVNRAYCQRLSQLKSELGLDQMDSKETKTPVPPQRSKSTSTVKSVYSYGKEAGRGETMPATEQRSLDHDALIDAVFGEVLDGEMSEQTNLGESSLSQTLQETVASDECSDSKKIRYLTHKPGLEECNSIAAVHTLKESGVKEYVTELLDQSLDDAMSSASISLEERAKREGDRSPVTDTSFDRKHREQRPSIGPNNHKEEEKEEEKDQKSHDVDPNIKEVYTSNINNQQLMESVISYPHSVASPRLASPAVMTSERDRSAGEFDGFLESHSHAHQNTGDDITFVSSASVVMNDTHSSSDGEFDNDHIMKLVFSQPTEILKLEPQSHMDRSQNRGQVSGPEQASETPDSSLHYQTDSRSCSSMDHSHRKTDDEVLEIEVYPDHFTIKGSYAMFINKEEEPLGRLLEELHSRGTSSLDFSITPKLRRLLFQCIQEKAYPAAKDLLSSRARNLLVDEEFVDMADAAMEKNRFSEQSNLQGNINFCTVENNLCADEVMFHLKRHGFSPTEMHLIRYPPPGGHQSTKRVMSKYLKEFMSATVDENELVILPSTISAYDMLCHCTCEADDIVLTAAPTYAASVRNIGARAHCRLRTVETDMASPKLDLVNYQKALDSHHSKGEVVRAVLIINPHNPLGAIFPPDEVIQLCNWATRNNLVVLVDESFSSCVFGSSSFKSFLTYRHQLEKPKLVVYIWGLSKDFGIPGLKISVVQTSSSELMTSLSRLTLIYPVSALAHDAASVLLSDYEWLRKFHALKLARLSAHYKFVVRHLHEIGLNFIPAVAGCFVMADFRKHLRSQTFASELSLFQSLCDRGVMLTPGQQVLAQQPGWMRLVFGGNRKELVEGINRLRSFFNLPSVQDTVEY
ncbi:hypothetical protein KIN20_034328 [Parelaphostrongylus tenuis]|uniref:Aminotransferase class I/classII large domain-containing protein n=1 Tax=Parelaphostrongylus tenuis TaxID=148309 RepID=A0AAD5WJ50_PARTN|nr:hypothetical protein KIN20_034328 [Parelaphostrongylus tenuis]